LRFNLANDEIFDSPVGETHRDQCLATFAALNLPVSTPIQLKVGTFSIGSLLSESVANFSFDQHEPAWTAMAYAKYLPPKKEWTNRFGEKTTFSQMTEYLIGLDPNSQSCAGTHIFQALAAIDGADKREAILDHEARTQLDRYMTATISQVIFYQQSDGGWNWQWCDAIRGSSKSIDSRILVTGHLLEVLTVLDSRRGFPEAVSRRAAVWAKQALSSPDFHPDASLICPFTHASRGIRTVLGISWINDGSAGNTFRRAE
jgi:hypothetical protein